MAVTVQDKVVQMNANNDTHAPGNPFQVQAMTVALASSTGVDIRFNGGTLNTLWPNGAYVFNPPLKVTSVELEDRDTAGVLTLIKA